jgi:hypothetical protein
MAGSYAVLSKNTMESHFKKSDPYPQFPRLVAHWVIESNQPLVSTTLPAFRKMIDYVDIALNIVL